MPKFNRVVVHSEDEAWEHFKPIVDAAYELGLYPTLVFFLIDPIQYGFAKFIALDNGHDQTPLFWDSYDEARLYKEKLDVDNTQDSNDYPAILIEICATILIDDKGIAVRPKETK